MALKFFCHDGNTVGLLDLQFRCVTDDGGHPLQSRPWLRSSGSSSIRVGMMSPWMSVPCRLLVRTRMSATGLAGACGTFKRVMITAHGPADMENTVAGRIDAHILDEELQNPGPSGRRPGNDAAEEISPGTAISSAIQFFGRSDNWQWCLPVRTSAPKSLNISSVWLRERDRLL